MTLINTHKLVFFLVKQVFRYSPLPLVLLLMVFQATENEASTTTYETEPNNQINNADPILSSTVKGQLSIREDLDYYQFKTNEQKVVKLQFNINSETGCNTHKIRVIDSNKIIYGGTEIGLYGKKNAQVDFFLDHPNNFFIVVSSAFCHDAGEYTLALSLDPTPIYPSCKKSIEEQTSCQKSKNYEKLLSELDKQNKIVQKSYFC